MREMTRSAVALAAEALRVGESALPRYSSKHSRRDGYTLPQLFAVLVMRKFLKFDYRGMEVRLSEWAELREAIGLSRTPDYSALCLAEGKLLERGGRPIAGGVCRAGAASSRLLQNS